MHKAPSLVTNAVRPKKTKPMPTCCKDHDPADTRPPWERRPWTYRRHIPDVFDVSGMTHVDVMMRRVRGKSMKLITKAEACRELAVSLSTLDRRIASGEIRTKREQRGRRHRVYVMLDDPLDNGVAAKSQGTLLDVAPGADSGVGQAGGPPSSPACTGAGAEHWVGGGLSKGSCRARQDEAGSIRRWFGRRRAARTAGRQRSGRVASAGLGPWSGARRVITEDAKDGA